MKKLTPKEVAKFQDFIWNFYKLHGREMPWRHQKNPFKVLVSEIMLQQTQVSRVLLYYPIFLKTFPTIEKLANAPLSRVLRMWQGLGYNRRAKYIYRLAQIVVREYGGEIPHEYEALVSLPGIGKGTAGSLLAFAFNMPVVFIETNIRRVYIQHFFSKKNGISDKELLPLIEQTIDKRNPREWYYALMDFGATLKENNPNRKSTHYAKQSKFEGSNREVRGSILRYLVNHKKLSVKKGNTILGITRERFSLGYQDLLKEGFIKQKGEVVILSP